MSSSLLVIFATVFLAELGDKTQFATLLFAVDGRTHPILVFIAASGALMGSTAMAVTLGSIAEQWLAVIPLKLVAGMGFVLIGLWTIGDYFRVAG